MTHLCLADIGGPFYALHKPFRNWSALPFYQLDLPQPPYVDQAQLAWGTTRAISHLGQLQAQGYNGIVIDNLAHLVTFDQAPALIYPPASPYRQRAAIYGAAFRQLFTAAAERGMAVYVTSDMQWSTPPLRAYVGALSADNPRLAALNRWALEELFRRFPQVQGLFVRVGEAGGAHDQGGDYAGHMLYRSARELRGLIGDLLPTCERFGRQLIVRTWSIGIGELGDLMWSPARYRAAFGGFTSPNLLVSVKHGPSDFFRLLPHNPTLGLPGPRQIIELQNRREYELFGMVPSSVAGLHQDVLQGATQNQQFAGVWAWNSSGGWGGGQAALGSQGWSMWTELSSALTAALVREPALDTAAFINQWCVTRFARSGDAGEMVQRAAFGAATAELYRESGALIEQGWYLGPINQGRQTLGAVYVPPLLWVWWMRPTAAPLIWAYLAAALGQPAAVLRAGQQAAARLAWHTERLAALAPEGDPQAAFVVTSSAYLRDVIAIAQHLRSLLLPAFAAAHQGDWAGWLAQAHQAPAVRTALQTYAANWAGRSDFPPLELDEVLRYLDALARAPQGLWRQARATCQLVDRVQRRALPTRPAYAVGMTAAAVVSLALLRYGRGRTAVAGALTSYLLARRLRQPAIRRALPWLSRRWYILPSIFFETGPSFTEWTG